MVIDRSGFCRRRRRRVAGTRSRPACCTSTGRWARTVGSPPVSRRPSTSKRSTKMRARRSISSNVSTSLRGSHFMPSSGMQYVQRKLQRSVTEMRRSRMVRPNGSIRIHSRHGSPSTYASPRRQRSSRDRSADPPTATPSPSATTAMALASDVAASWWLPCAPDGAHVHPAVGAERGEHAHVVRSCRRVRRGRPSSATASTVGRSSARVAHHLPQRRAGEQFEADQRADRVAGQAEHRHLPPCRRRADRTRTAWPA